MNVKKKSAPTQHGNIDLRTIGRRIREIRGFERNQEEFARQLGISQSQLSKYERGLAPPSTEFAVRMKERFGISIDWLLTGKE
jgi:transcriptional regulator with XRE-family HTH domain